MRLSGRFKPYSGPRLRLVVGCLLLMFCAIVIRLVVLQVFQHARLRDLAERQYSRQLWVNDPLHVSEA
jgi:cell division protein FtsI/penicillin-binding protein 2